MRLLNTTTIQLRAFFGGQIPCYAILSHTWSKDNEEEISFKDIQQSRESCSEKKLFGKIDGACKVARENGYE